MTGQYLRPGNSEEMEELEEDAKLFFQVEGCAIFPSIIRGEPWNLNTRNKVRGKCKMFVQKHMKSSIPHGVNIDLPL